MYVCVYVCSELRLCIYICVIIIHVATFSDLHIHNPDLGPTKDTVNPAYHIVTNPHFKETELAEEPNSDYEEVNRPPEVKMTPNPAYAVP